MLQSNKISLFKRVLVLCLFQAITFYGMAQFSVTGKVTDEQGNSLQGATIVLKNTYLGTNADANGKYVFSKLKQGKYQLIASFMGYESATKTVDLQKDTELNFTLTYLPLMTDEVIVQATRAGNKTPMALSNLSNKQIEENNVGQDIPYQISLLPSVVSSSEAGAGIGNTTMRIRGTDATRINVTVNGIPLNDSESQGVYWVNMPDFGSSVDNVQVQRGVGTSTNGAAAFGATVNFKTDNVNQKPYAEINNVAGSFNTLRNTFKAGTGLIKDHFSFDARYSRLNSDGFIDRAFSNHNSLFLGGSYYTEKSLLKMNIIHGKQRTGISWWGNPDMEKKGRTYNPAGEDIDDNGNITYYDNQTDNYIQTHYQLFYSRELTNSLYLNTALHYTRGDGYYEQYKDRNNPFVEEDAEYGYYGLKDVISKSETDTIKRTDIIRQKKMANDFYGFTSSLKYRKNSINAVLGGAWNKYDGDHFGKLLWAEYGGVPKDYEWYRNNGTKTDFNVFAKVNYAINSQLNIYGDIQYRHINYEMTGIDDDSRKLEQEHKFNFVNPKAGVFYTINNNNNVYASFAIAHREPTRANFKDANGDPNSYPKYETLYDYELGYNYTSAKATAGVNLYFMNYKDQLVPTGAKSSVGYDIMTNVEKSYRAGIELVGGVQLFSKLRWDMNLTLSKNRIKNFVSYAKHYDTVTWKKTFVGTELGETHISYSPELIGSSIINYEPFKNFNISFITKYVGEQYFDNTSSDDRKLDAYLVNNLRLNYSISTKLVKQIAFNVQINNLFNAEYENNAYGGHWFEAEQEKTWKYYFPQAGINFLAGISLKF